MTSASPLLGCPGGAPQGKLGRRRARPSRRWNAPTMPRHFALASGGVVDLIEDWLEPPAANQLFVALRGEIAWRQERIRIAGRSYPQPRLVAWFGDPGTTYTYSGLELVPAPWPERLASLRARLEHETKARFNSVLCNLYRDGNDSMGIHA